ncbi:uncharacterized protein SPPG_05786 [Spizellomyces punctatus DAOM BR117]|uniref:PH domain-containing protein n=1 Tax=Spizellomyces punctatus (strain DAOM BR117) TaxID=645134 RepID=A0A0L0HDI8_SPIPD|nr:uncharacterized protein SPPG_05786 [Spizellomyces punctatus DAOM BR117]KNC98808.1 hypothetical protein SPPG_05786 [Spizellomyces punctatus DAOM BR117]|eukprot:XP_016606848.1 hypothetical protein SPPG_05786 [Spizellomyces punctatus DAOM BR117]
MSSLTLPRRSMPPNSPYLPTFGNLGHSTSTAADFLRMQKPLPSRPDVVTDVPIPPRTKSSPRRAALREDLYQDPSLEDEFAAGLIKLLSGSGTADQRDGDARAKQAPSAVPPRKASLSHAMGVSVSLTGSPQGEEPPIPGRDMAGALEQEQYIKVSSIYQTFFTSEPEEMEESRSQTLSRTNSMHVQMCDLMDMYNMDEATPIPRLERSLTTESVRSEWPTSDNHASRKSSKSSKSSKTSSDRSGSLGRPKSPKLLPIFGNGTLARTLSRSKSRTVDTPRTLAEQGLTNPDREGHLLFRVDRDSPWKRRWCLLKNEHVYVLKSQMDNTVMTIIMLTPDLIVLPDDSGGNSTGTTSRSNKAQYAFKIVTPQPGTGSHAIPFYFAAESRLDMLMWIADLVKVANGAPIKAPRTLIPIRSECPTLSRDPLISFSTPTENTQSQPSQKTSGSNKRFTLQNLTQKLKHQKPIRKLRSFSLDSKKAAVESQPPSPPPPPLPIQMQLPPQPELPPNPMSQSLPRKSDDIVYKEPPRYPAPTTPPPPVPPERTISLSPMSLPEVKSMRSPDTRRSGMIVTFDFNGNGRFGIGEDGDAWYWDPDSPPVPPVPQVYAKA